MKKFLIILAAVLVCTSLQAQNSKKNQSKKDKEYEQKKAALYEEFIENGKWHNAVIPPDRIRAMKIKKQIDSLTKVRDSLMHYTDSLIVISDNNRERINNDINSLRKDYYAVSESALADVYRIKRGHSRDSLEKILANLSPKMRKSKAAQRIKEYLTEEPLMAGDKFWEFTCYTLDGKKFNWKRVRGKKILIILDGYDCMGGHRDPLAFKKYADENIKDKLSSGSNFAFLPFFYAENTDIFKESVKRYGLEEYNPVSDLEGNLSKIEITYGVTATPMCVYINTDGTIKAITEGFEPKDLEEFIK